ncbi:hypothetical protein V3C99_006434 [Haemonchus contortus]
MAFAWVYHEMWTSAIDILVGNRTTITGCHLHKVHPFHQFLFELLSLIR